MFASKEKASPFAFVNLIPLCNPFFYACLMGIGGSDGRGGLSRRPRIHDIHIQSPISLMHHRHAWLSLHRATAYFSTSHDLQVHGGIIDALINSSRYFQKEPIQHVCSKILGPLIRSWLRSEVPNARSRDNFFFATY